MLCAWRAGVGGAVALAHVDAAAARVAQRAARVPRERADQVVPLRQAHHRTGALRSSPRAPLPPHTCTPHSLSLTLSPLTIRNTLNLCISRYFGPSIAIIQLLSIAAYCSLDQLFVLSSIWVL